MSLLDCQSSLDYGFLARDYSTQQHKRWRARKEQFEDWLDEAYPPKGEAEGNANAAGEEAGEIEEEEEDEAEEESYEHRD